MTASRPRPPKRLGFVLAGLLAIGVVGVAVFFLIVALSIGDPCGTTGPCRKSSQSHRGMAILGPDNPTVRIPFEASFSEFALTEGVPWVEIHYRYSWAGVDSPPETPDIAFETPLGEYQVRDAEDRCLEVCREPGEMVLRWPKDFESGSLLVDWSLQAVAGFSTEPRGGGVPDLSVDVPPSPSLQGNFVGGFGREQDTQYAMSAARLTVTELSGDSGHLRLAWQKGRGLSEQEHQEQIVRWATGETTFEPGLAVEIPVHDLCRPECVVDMVASWVTQPESSPRNVAGNEQRNPISAGGWVLVIDPIAELLIEHVPVPSIESPTVERSLELDTDETRHLRIVLTSPLSTAAPRPVALITANVEVSGFSPESPGQVSVAIGNSELQLGPRNSQTAAPHFQTPVPLSCASNGCMADITISLTSIASPPVNIELSILANVFHPDFEAGSIELDLHDLSSSLSGS